MFFDKLADMIASKGEEYAIYKVDRGRGPFNVEQDDLDGLVVKGESQSHLSGLEVGGTAVPNRLAGNFDRLGSLYTWASIQKDLETTEWPESGGLSRDRTSARFHAAHGSGLPLPLQSLPPAPDAGGHGRFLDH